jgi:N-hydroxyarylamine O-acetyltransferase
MLDLAAYLRRIGYDGPRLASLDTLRALHLRHTENIPFENLNPLLGWPVALDAASLEAKIVRGGRGGWCFEQNWLFRYALEAIGFHVRGLAARVLWGAADGHAGARSHMVLEVELDGEAYLADVGFGGPTPTAPLRMIPDVEQPTPHERFRLREPAAGDYHLEMDADAWRPLYRFRRDEQLLPDYEVSSWYLCHHPESFFRRDLVAARTFPGGRLALRNNVLTVHRTGRPADTRRLDTADEIQGVLESEMKLTLPDASDLDRILDRIARTVSTRAAGRRPG